jgi:hypothetical protein
MSCQRLNDEDTQGSDVTGVSTRPRVRQHTKHERVSNENEAILAALANGNSTSKERDGYHHQRTKKLKMENRNGKEREGLKLASQRARTTAEVAQSITQMYAAAKQAEENGVSEKVVQSIRKRAEKLVSSMGRLRATTARSSDTGSDVSSSSDDDE